MKTGSRIDEKRAAAKILIDYIDSEAIIDLVAEMLRIMSTDIDGYDRAIVELKGEV